MEVKLYLRVSEERCFFFNREGNLPLIENHTSVVYDDKIWAIGGSTPIDPEFAFSFEGFRTINDVWYSSEGRDWHRLNNTPWESRSGHSSVVFDAKSESSPN